MADFTGECAATVEQLEKAMANSANVVANGLNQQLKEALPGLMDESEELRELRTQLKVSKAATMESKTKYAILNTQHIQN